MSLQAELETACRILEPRLVGHRLRGAGVVAGCLDLCLFFAEPPHPRLRTLRIATGGPGRARCLCEALKLGKGDWLEGETPRRLDEALAGARLTALGRVPGERRVVAGFEDESGRRCKLIAECFGPQGLWFLCDGDDRIVASSRRPGGARAGLTIGARYAPPSAGSTKAEEPVALPADPDAWLEQQAAHFATLEAAEAWTRGRDRLARALERERKALSGRIAGLEQRREAEAGWAEVQREAELLLATPDPHRRGLASIEVLDWYDEGRLRRVDLDTRLDLRQNAERRFERARRLRDGAVHSASLLDEAVRRLHLLDEALAALAVLEAGGERDPERLAVLEDDCRALLRSPQPKAAGRRRPVERRPYKSFRSRDGWPILVGRSNADNDRLSLSIARGNDWWLHVGQGVAGSHVVVRAPRDKPPSLETLLDAAHLALHFSKLRGRLEGEVLYTQRKHLRKRKGAPRGAVEVVQSKTLRVRLEPERLERVLGTLSEEEA